MFKHMTKSLQTNYFYYKWKNDSLDKLRPKNNQHFSFEKIHPYTILSIFFYNLLDLRRQIKSTFSLKTRRGPNCEFASCESLPPPILQIVLKGTPFFKSFAWLPHGQLLAIIEGRASIIRY